MSQLGGGKRWNASELIEILIYLNNNFGDWYENSYGTCNKAVEATNNSRGANSVYCKVHKMIRAMDDYLTTGKKQSRDIIWKDQLIYDLIKRIHRKTKERKVREENEEAIKRRNLSYRIIEDDTEMQLENINSQMTAGTESTSQLKIEVPQLPFSIDTIDSLRSEQILKTERHAQELVALSKESIDARHKEVRELTGKILQHQIELEKMIKEANDKLEKLKDVNSFND
ncbi:unnamed protein product [Rhizophagus irregularis]|nr:unnamed protein product [Rhizophagus irregularis]CAB5389452.1 unnamed protein product [Rhizophagus irregularis]